MYAWFNMLGAMPMLRGGRSCSINWENRTGEKGAGCKAASDLGPGRKGSPAPVRSYDTGRRLFPIA